MSTERVETEEVDVRCLAKERDMYERERDRLVAWFKDHQAHVLCTSGDLHGNEPGAIATRWCEHCYGAACLYHAIHHATGCPRSEATDLKAQLDRCRALLPRMKEAIHVGERGIPLGRNTVELLREIAALIGERE